MLIAEAEGQLFKMPSKTKPACNCLPLYTSKPAYYGTQLTNLQAGRWE